MIRIGRPLNCLITALSVVTAGMLLRDIPSLGLLAMAAAGAGLVCGFGNAVNDCADRAIDSINRPDRLIPSGRLTPRQAYVAALLHVVAGLALSLAVGILPLCIACVTALMLGTYALAVKRLPVLSNVWVALLAAMTFPFAMAIVGEFGLEQSGLAWFGAILAFLFHVGREIIKDIEDMPGDAAGGVRSLPLVIGRDRARFTALTILTLHSLLAIAAYPLLNLSIWYLAASSAYLAICAIVLRRLSKASDVAGFRTGQRLLKLLMPLGLVLLLIARFTV
jgi:geranylgeranylglycerol-phosphate geranylgeranyltransferase